MKRIFAIILIAFVTLPVIYSMFYIANTPDPTATAAMRDWDQGSVKIILDTCVPLGTSTDASYCIETLRLVNEYRVANGRQPLLWNEELAAAAEIRAQESTIRWSHIRPNNQQYYTVNKKVVYGENLGRGYATPRQLVDAWIASPTHNDNLLFAEFGYAGIALVDGHCALEFCY